MATIHDVARRAEVSVGTVSRVLNGHSEVRALTRRVVLAAIDELDYHPNALARNLRLSRTGTIGVIVGELANPTNAAIVQGIEEESRRRDINLFLCNSGGSSAAQGAHLRRLTEHRVDGVVLHPTGDYRQQIAGLCRAGTPLLLIGQRQASGDLPQIVIDEHEASLAAFALLLRLGHRRIGLVTRGYRDGDAPPTSAIADRVRAYREAHRLANVPVDDSLIAAASTAEQAHAAATALLVRPARPTALVAGMHTYTPEILAAAREAGLRVPRDLSLLAFGDSAWARVFDPPITVVRTDYAAYGRQAATMLFRLMEGQEEASILHLRSELVERASCAPPE